MRYHIALFALLTLAPRAQAQDVDALLDTVQHTAFNFFWNEANPTTGLIPDRANVNGGHNAPCSIASLGFGLTAIAIGADHSWVSRADAAQRVLTALKTLWNGPQGPGADGTTGYLGLFYHFIDMSTARRAWSSELSTIDTALLLAGIIDSKQYFDGPDPTETAIRSYADSLYYRMNWEMMRNFHPGILMEWKPGTGFSTAQWHGYCEAMIMYILAAGSPTYPIDSTGWTEWTKNYQWVTYYGIDYLGFAPLFGHQYSHCWIDFRGIADTYMRGKGIDYFENSRRATFAQRAYCIDNPGHFAGYGDSLWGITASDVQGGYSARGGPPNEGDNGTLVPTAPISSIAFAPDIALPVIRNMWNAYRPQLWGAYGFRDAFNIGTGWWGPDVIGIDLGPEIIMIENYRTGKVWKRFMQNPDVQRGLKVMGFSDVTSADGISSPVPVEFRLEQNYPNPFNPSTTIRFALGGSVPTRLAVYDLLGREMAVVAEGTLGAGSHEYRFDASRLSSGMYFFRLTAGDFVSVKKMTLVK
jgi:hypothetical protein